MKVTLLVALVIVPLSARGQTAPAPNEAPSTHDQIRIDRAKANSDFENGPKERAWDRDAQGKRPWDQKYPPRPKE